MGVSGLFDMEGVADEVIKGQWAQALCSVSPLTFERSAFERMPGTTDQGWKQKPYDGKRPRGDVQAASFRRGARGLHLRKSPVLESVSFFSFDAANLWSKLGLVVAASSETVQIQEGDSNILAALDSFLISCQLHASVPPAFPLPPVFFPVYLFACKTSIPFFSIQENLLVFPSSDGKSSFELGYSTCDCLVF